MTNEPNGVKWTDKAIVILTGGIVIAAVVQTVIFSKQRSEMHNAGAQTDRIICAAQKIESDLEAANAQNLDALKKILAQSQAATEASNKQSQKVLDANIATAHLQERAWVAPITVEMDTIESGKGESGYVAWINSGKTFAKKVKALCHSSSRPNPISDEHELVNLAVPPQEMGSIGVLTPGAQYQIILKNPQPVSKLQLDAMITYSWYTYVWGEVTYEDVFGNAHTTTFCAFRRGISGSFSQCPFYNDAN